MLLQMIAPGDIAIYATLWALATFPRTMIRAQLLDNDNFGMYIEQEPYVRELLEAYMNNRFKTVLETLERYSVSLPAGAIMMSRALQLPRV